MNYIRTKDGRILKLIAYKLVLETPTLLKFEYILNGGILFVQKDNILKQADTIEDLCDEFVSTYDKYRDHWDNLKECLQLCWDGGAEIYGAIWTDKGLIYVAKMNEKGELELL